MLRHRPHDYGGAGSFRGVSFGLPLPWEPLDLKKEIAMSRAGETPLIPDGRFGSQASGTPTGIRQKVYFPIYRDFVTAAASM